MAHGEIRARTAQPAVLAAVLGHGITEALAARLQAMDRLLPRLDRIVAAQLDALGELDAMQAQVLQMDMPSLARLASEAGAVWHGASIARLLDGEAVRTLVALIGAELWQTGLRRRALCGPSDASTPTEIAAALPGDGAACLAAWCEAQSAPIAALLAPRRPPAMPAPAHRAAGPAIVAALILG